MAPNTTSLFTGCPLGWDTSVRAVQNDAKLEASRGNPGYCVLAAELPSDSPANHKGQIGCGFCVDPSDLFSPPSLPCLMGPGEITAVQGWFGR